MKLKEGLVDDFPAVMGAYNYAKRKHDATGAIRQNSGLPYFVHPEMVAEVVATYGGTDEEIEAALLHDTLEDTDATAEELETLYGPEVAQIVEEVTNFKPEVDRLGKEQYINNELLELSDSAMLVKVADMVVNANDSPKKGQRERIVRNFKHLLEFYEDDLDPRVRRLLKALPEIERFYDLDNSEFDEPFDEFSDEPMYLVSAKNTNKEKRIFS